MKQTIIIVSGARPNFPKVAPIIAAISRLPVPRRPRVVHVHTGQHYDFMLSQVFFDELRIPKPDHFLAAGSGSHAVQTAAVMAAFERVLLAVKPAMVVVVGDVNSTLACALTAAKLGIAVAHVEAGLRSGDQSMPEEINRVLTDQLADLLFTPSHDAGVNLVQEGRPKKSIRFAGNVMIDSLQAQLPLAMQRPLLRDLGLERSGAVRPYALVTLHRPSNVDDQATFTGIIRALQQIARGLPVLYPAHPRARASIKQFGLRQVFTQIQSPQPAIGPNGLYLMDLLGYLDFIRAEMGAACVRTDSGGVQEETSYLGVPCLTIRANTERPVTISLGTNRLAGVSTASILKAWRAFRKQQTPSLSVGSPKIPRCRIPRWDGHAAPRIAEAIVRFLHKQT